jgi:Fur family peroxide stress response transcriptional regulator
MESDNHPSAEMIYQRIREEYPDISLGTVYRNLALLAEDGLIRKIGVPDAADRFDRTTDLHYHIFCTRCGAFADVHIDYDHTLDRKVALASDFAVASHSLVFTGLCHHCQMAVSAGSDTAYVQDKKEEK